MQYARVFVIVRHINLWIILVDKAGAYPSENLYVTPLWRYIPSLAYKYKSWLEVTDNYKYYSLLQNRITYAC